MGVGEGKNFMIGIDRARQVVLGMTVSIVGARSETNQPKKKSNPAQRYLTLTKIG